MPSSCLVHNHIESDSNAITNVSPGHTLPIIFMKGHSTPLLNITFALCLELPSQIGKDRKLSSGCLSIHEKDLILNCRLRCTARHSPECTVKTAPNPLHLYKELLYNARSNVLKARILIYSNYRFAALKCSDNNRQLRHLTT